MPKSNTTLHLAMYRNWKRRNSFRGRVKNAIKVLMKKKDIYGLEWGDPEVNPSLKYVKEHFVTPYISKDTTVVEIGPGGGRWTRYMLSAKKLYVVDCHWELLNELKKNFYYANISYIKNNGNDFPDIQDQSVDYLFSFGTFVHLDLEIIDQYLKNMKRILKRNATVVLQYSDKTKPLGKNNKGFSNNDPEKMRKLVKDKLYLILEEDLYTLPHSSIMRIGIEKSGRE